MRRTSLPYEWKGSLPTVRFGKWQIESESVSGAAVIQQTARGPNGKVIRSTVAAVNDVLLSRPSVLLDAVASELHLVGQWQRGLHTFGADAAELDLGQNRSLKFHMRTISPGQRLGVDDGTGTPLFWDLDIPLNIASQFKNAVPTRLVVTSRGSLELAFDRAYPGAVDAMWIARQSGRTIYSLRFIEPTNAVTPVAQAISARGVHAEMVMQCGYTTTTSCWDYEGGSYCEVDSYPLYCNFGCGCSPPPGDDGGNGGNPVIAPTVTVASVDTIDPANPIIAIDVHATDNSHPRRLFF